MTITFKQSSKSGAAFAPMLLALAASVAALPVAPAFADDTGVTPSISVGRVDTQLLRDDGSVWGCAGFNDNYSPYFTNFPPAQQGYPVQQLPPGSAEHISAGSYHALAETAGAGDNYSGELGANNPNSVPTYSPVEGLLTHGVAGYDVTYFIKSGGLFGAGDNGYGQLAQGTWDYNYNPDFVPILTAPGTPLENVTKVVPGTYMTVALTKGGVVWQWGQIDADYTKWIYYAQPFPGLAGVKIRTLSANPNSGHRGLSGDHILALAEDGTVWAWGYNGDGEIGNNTQTGDNGTLWKSTPVQVLKANGSPLRKIIGIASGGAHSLAVDESGRVWSWGYNGSGQLGRGQVSDTAVSLYADIVPGLKDIAAVYTGAGQSFAVDYHGHAWAWGWNYDSSLCIGPAADTTDGHAPGNQIVTPTRLIDSNGRPFNLRAHTGD